MACEVLTVTGAGTTAVNGTYTQIAASNPEIWTHSSGNYAIVRLGIMGPPGYIKISTYPTYGGPGSVSYYETVYSPGPTAPACPAGVTLSVQAGSPDAPTIAEGAPVPPYIQQIIDNWGSVENFRQKSGGFQ